jgi:PAS domain S-box-containing protein
MAESTAFAFLVIDDEAADALMLKSLLESQKDPAAKCIICADLDECRSILETKKIDCIFLSYRFDASSGFEFLKAARKTDSERPVIILTSRGDEHITAEILRSGASDYLPKTELSSLRIRRIIEHMAERLSENQEKKLAETLMRLNEQNYRKLVDNIPDVVFVHRDGEILFVNQSVQPLLGYTEEEVVGKTVFDFIPDEKDRNKAQNAIGKRERGDEVGDYEISVLDKKNARHTVMVRATATVFNDEPAYQVVLVDITERKRLEEELLKKRKLESLGILAGGIAHDFNNALTGIISGIAAAKMKLKKGSEVFEILEAMEKASFKASELTQELLTFSQGGEPMREPCSIGRLIEQTIKIYPQTADITCSIELPDDLFAVVIDKSQIGQVLSNLFLNAAQAMPAGGTITVKASNITIGEHANTSTIETQPIADVLPLADGPYVRVDVSDTGMGIAPAHIEKIFDPYFTTKSSGTGLGLATVYSIIQKHNGHIHASSEVGDGTTFTFYLPATREDVDAQAATQAKPKKADKVLIMDDDVTIQFTLKRYLTGVGYEVACVDDGEKAIQVYKAAIDKGERFLAVLLDLSVPEGLGGKNTMKLLQKLDPKARAIAVSGYSNESVLANYRKYGFTGVLRKPFRPEQLKSLLEELSKKANAS